MLQYPLLLYIALKDQKRENKTVIIFIWYNCLLREQKFCQKIIQNKRVAHCGWRDDQCAKVNCVSRYMNKQIEKFILKKPTQQQKSIKEPGTNLKKDVQDRTIEKQNTVLKDMKENLNKWRNSPYSWLAIFNIEKMSTVHKLICRYNATVVKISILLLIFFFGGT